VVAASHVLDVALEGGERDFELAEELAHGDHATLADEVVDLVEPFGAVHPEVCVHRAFRSWGSGEFSVVEAGSLRPRWLAR